MFEVPTGTSGCGALDYTKLKASGVERTPALIEAALGRADAFNAGLYERALMLKESSITWGIMDLLKFQNKFLQYSNYVRGKILLCFHQL